MRHDFELASNALIEVDLYCFSQRNTPTAKIASIFGSDFSAGRGTSDVDLRWNHPKEFKELSNKQKDELYQWQQTQEDKKVLDKSTKTTVDKPKSEEDNKSDTKSQNQGSWKEKLKKAVKTKHGLKTIMSVIATEEGDN
mmetsp:Transcript_5656/g.5287  ORF Transcript_5656/g.5287 Transcript_5656/m.5287 type:complete len:139 (-) Transcript_5656:25-441(-)